MGASNWPPQEISMDISGSDPIDWEVDEVVRFLCDSTRPWSEGSNLPFPKPEDLAAALHENFVTGEVLLEEIDKNSLKDDLGVKPLGHRSGIMKAIGCLRNRSAKYQAKHHLSLMHNTHGEASPRDTLSPQVPHTKSPGIDTPASETLSLTTPQAAGLSSTTAREKRRIVPQLVGPVERREPFEGNTNFTQEQSFPNATPASVATMGANIAADGQLHIATASIAQNTNITGSSEYENSNQIIRNPERAMSQSHNPKFPPEDAFYRSLLERYPPDDGDADGLPLYGDSGSEGQLDEETWLEMQNEAEELEERSNQQAPNEKPSLSREECIALIAQHVTQKEADWKEKRLPRELPKAPNLWDHSHIYESLEQDKSRLVKRISLYQKRLEKLKGGLLEVDFTDRAFFLQSCGSLDPTIADLCLDKWTLQVLELENRPPDVEPPPRAAKPRKERLVTGDEETLETESDSYPEEDYPDSENSESGSEEEESDFVEIDPDDEVQPAQDLTDKPHKGLPFTLDSPPPETDDDSTSQPAPKKRRIHEDGSDEEMTSDTGIFSEVLRRGDIDTVDLTGTIPPFISTTGVGSNSAPLSPTRSRVEASDEDPDEMEIETPPLNPVASATKDDDVTQLWVDSPTKSPAQNTRLKLTGPRPPGSDAEYSRQVSSDINDTPKGLSSVISDPVSSVDEDDIELFNTVKQLDIESIIASKNRLQLLAKSILALRSKESKRVSKYLDNYYHSALLDHVHEALIAIQNDRHQLPDRDEDENRAVMRLAALYHSWFHCVALTNDGLDRPLLKETISQIESQTEEGKSESVFSRFIEKLTKLFESYDAWSSNHPTHAHGLQNTAPGALFPKSKTSKKAKHKVKYASRVPSNMQREAQLRQKRQEAMRREREKRGFSNSDPDKQVVTFKEPLIYLHREIGEHVKPHQLAGIQFMWRELIEAEKPQGCLLAHVMGLGKTMQVISLLVTISEAASSDDPQVSQQVPKKFHRSQTLVLCPSAVVQNWADEFAFWAPKDHHLGPIWEIMSGNNMATEERFQTIMEWNEEGGVLIISYDLFRILVLNKSTRPNQNSLSDEEHEMAKDALLSGPNIVVADEAHKLKNEKSAISQVTSRFKTSSRIAMTGSPLANHLSEYYQMVEWVAPGYLESQTTFKTKFVDPIQCGSYLDSTRQQQRESLCALKILNGILKPKVLRADTSVIAADLPSKTEFVIRIPLTDLQKLAYNTFVHAARSGDDIDASLYSWLAILQLCCNHPQPFWEKLADRSKQPDDTEGSVLPKSMSESGLPTSLLSQMNNLFKSVKSIMDPSLSHRATLLTQILDESIKMGDKVLIFTQSIPTLNYIHFMLNHRQLRFERIDGSTSGADRQAITKRFNFSPEQQVLLISTKAGGVGLNMFGANRVVIFDFLFNPTWEDQAIGRSYRLGQTKPVYVYRFVAGGTFEENIFNKAVFKRQLAVRVVDKKNVVRQSVKKSPTILHPVQETEKQDHTEILGKDKVLDKILAGPYGDIILDISVSRIQDNENDRLTEAESLLVDDELKMERLKRSNPLAYEAEKERRHNAEVARQRENEANDPNLTQLRKEAFMAANGAPNPRNQMNIVASPLGGQVRMASHLLALHHQAQTFASVPNSPMVPHHAQQTRPLNPADLLNQTPAAGLVQPRLKIKFRISEPLTNGLNTSQVVTNVNELPRAPPLQQNGHQESQQAPESNLPESDPDTLDDANPPIEVIDLCEHSSPDLGAQVSRNQPTQSSDEDYEPKDLVIGEEAAKSSDEEYEPKDMSASEATPAIPPVSNS